MSNQLLAINQITREALELFVESNVFLRSMPVQFDDMFVSTVVKEVLPSVPLPAAVAMGVAAVVIKNPPVTRRFWQGWFE